MAKHTGGLSIIIAGGGKDDGKPLQTKGEPCPDCGADVPPDANFCPMCGMEMQGMEPIEGEMPMYKRGTKPRLGSRNRVPTTSSRKQVPTTSSRKRVPTDGERFKSLSSSLAKKGR